MGTFVHDGNSCIGCTLSGSFPIECDGCQNLRDKSELILIALSLATECKGESGKQKEFIDCPNPSCNSKMKWDEDDGKYSCCSCASELTMK